MTRLLAIAFVVAFATLASAELENSVYTSKTEQLRLVVPRGWRATDQPSYPGLLLWMMRSEPEGRIVLTSEPFTRDVYCSWPVRCQMSHDALPAKAACALAAKLTAERIRVGPVQEGPKENSDAGLPSVWFEYDDGKAAKHFLRQAIAIDEDHVVSLVLSAPTADARNANVRAFEQALRTLRPLTPAELGIAPAGSAAAQLGSAAAQVGSGAGSAAGSAMLAPAGSDAAPPSTPSFQSAPPPHIEPVGACPRK